VWILVGAAIAAGGAWGVTDYLSGEPTAVEGPVPIVTAEAEPYKVRPDDPGGLEVPDRDKLIYETLTASEPEEAPEQLLPPPEEPVAPPEPEEVVAEVADPNALDPDRAAGTSDVEAAPPVPVTVEPISESAEGTEEPEALLVAEDEGDEAETVAAEDPDEQADAGAPSDAEIVMASTGSGADGTSPADEEPVPAIEAEAVIETSGAGESDPDVDSRAVDASTGAVADDQSADVPTPSAKPTVVAEEEPSDPAPTPEPTTVARADATAPVVASASDAPFLVQLGAVPVRASAARQWERLKSKHPDILSSLSPAIVQADLGEKGIWYRLRAGPFADRASADGVCERLKARDLGCFVVAN
jgi:cell division protein FtsN